MWSRLIPALRRLIRRLLAPLVIALAVLWALLDLTVWRWLSALGRVLARLPLFAWLERLVDRLSPGWVVTVFVLPFVPLVPLLKLAELWLLTHRHFLAAALLIIGTKVVGAAFSTRVFAIAKPKMMQLRWFARAYGAIAWLLELGHRTLEALPAWRAARAWTLGLKARFAARGRGALRRVWGSSRRWVRQRLTPRD
jgi:hypothetical protein